VKSGGGIIGEVGGVGIRFRDVRSAPILLKNSAVERAKVH